MNVSRSLVSSVYKKMIKPSSPTPTSLRCHKLSIMDQQHPEMMPFAFFYPKPSSNVSEHLEKSLSKVLAHYYPLAGKLNGNVSIDCNDNGVEFYITKIDCPMSRILNEPYADKENLVYPKGVPHAYSHDGSLGVFQLSHFNCGGIAVSACLSHTVADGYTSCNFLSDWATIARSDSSFELLTSPQFNGASIFPTTQDILSYATNNIAPPIREECLTKCFSFSSSKLDALKARVNEVQNPTDTEIVTAFIYQRAMATKKIMSLGSFCPSVLHQAVSLRPPLPKNSMGNSIFYFSIKTSEENEMDLTRVVSKLRKAKEEFQQKFKHAKPNEILPLMINEFMIEANNNSLNDADLYRFSSLIKFPLYDVDFGWGKPEKVCRASNKPVKNSFVMMENKNKGELEVTSTMKEPDILALEKDDEFLEFASSSW